jgi:hypothetical protein
VDFPVTPKKVSVKPMKKAVGQNYHNEEDDHWEKL